MKIEHLALWVQDLEKMKTFYETYFQATGNSLYHNTTKDFRSYFLEFEASSARIELMHKPAIKPAEDPRGLQEGLAHFAVSVGSRA